METVRVFYKIKITDMIMVYTLIAVACVFSGVAMLAALHVLLCFNKIEKSFDEWSQKLSDDCNDALNVRYSILVDAAKKDIKDLFDNLNMVSTDGQITDLSDVDQYVEENDVKIND